MIKSRLIKIAMLFLAVSIATTPMMEARRGGGRGGRGGRGWHRSGGHRRGRHHGRHYGRHYGWHRGRSAWLMAPAFGLMTAAALSSSSSSDKSGLRNDLNEVIRKVNEHTDAIKKLDEMLRELGYSVRELEDKFEKK